MMRFFRKHNKKLLAIFMALLMIVFVGGSALQSMLAPDARGEVVYKTAVGNVTRGDIDTAKAVMDTLDVLKPGWRRAVNLTPLDWVLLEREAKSLGLEKNLEAAEAGLLRDLADAPNSPTIQELAFRLRKTPAFLYESLAQLDVIFRAADMACSGHAPSEAEVRSAARSALEKATIRAAVLPIGAFADDEAELPEAELEDLFNKHRESVAGKGMDFGYRIPPSLKIQYLQIKHSVIVEKLKEEIASNERRQKHYENKAHKYYKSNRATAPEFKRGGVSEQPEEGPALSDTLEWEEAKEIAMDAVCNRKATDTARSIADWFIEQSVGPWRVAERDKDTRYRKHPEGVEDLGYYESLLSDLDERLKNAEATNVVVTDFFTPDETGSLKGIGWARSISGRPGANDIRRLAFKCEGMVEIPKDESPSEYLSLYETSSQVLKSGEDFYIWRVVETREAHAPETLAEVRSKVEADLRRVKSFDKAREQAEALMQATRTTGDLKAAFEADAAIATLKEESPLGGMISFAEPEPFSRIRKTQAYMAASKPGTIVSGLGYLQSDIVDQIFALEEASDPVAIIEMKEEYQPKVLVVQFIETTPGREDEFDELRTQLVSYLSQMRVSTAYRAWLDPENLRLRVGFSEPD